MQQNQMQVPQINTQKIKEIKDMYNIVRNSNNPNAMLNQMVNSNPQMKQIYDNINGIYNGNSKNAFYAEAHKMGLNDEQINQYLEQLKQQLQ